MERKVKNAPVKPDISLKAIKRAVKIAKYAEYLKIDQLKAGYLYRIDARRAGFGIWLPQRESFITSRIKFKGNILSEESHYDCESYGTVYPLEEIEKSPFNAKDINIVFWEKEGNKFFGYEKEKEILKYLNKFEPRDHFFELLSEKEQDEIRAKNWPIKG